MPKEALAEAGSRAVPEKGVLDEAKVPVRGEEDGAAQQPELVESGSAAAAAAEVGSLDVTGQDVVVGVGQEVLTVTGVRMLCFAPVTAARSRGRPT